MGISYKKLWKLLIDKDLIKKDLRLQCKLSTTTMSKLSKNQYVNTSVLYRISKLLDCDISDIAEFVDD